MWRQSSLPSHLRSSCKRCDDRYSSTANLWRLPPSALSQHSHGDHENGPSQSSSQLATMPRTSSSDHMLRIFCMCASDSSGVPHSPFARSRMQSSQHSPSNLTRMSDSLSGAAAPPVARAAGMPPDAAAALGLQDAQVLQRMDDVDPGHNERERHHGITRYAVALSSMPTALKIRIVMTLRLTRGPKPPLIEPRPEPREQISKRVLNGVCAWHAMHAHRLHIACRPLKMFLGHGLSLLLAGVGRAAGLPAERLSVFEHASAIRLDAVAVRRLLPAPRTLGIRLLRAMQLCPSKRVATHIGHWLTLTFRTALSAGAPPMPRHAAMASGAASDRSGSCRDEPTRRVVAEPRINPAVGQPPIRPLESDPRLQIALTGERQGLQKRPIVHLVRPNVLCEMIHGPQHAVFTRPVDETRILVRERVEPVVPAIERWPDHERMPVDRPELDATIQPPKRRPHPVHAGLARLAGRLTLRLDPLTRGTITTDPASRVLHLLNRWFHPTLLGNVMWPHGHSLTWT